MTDKERNIVIELMLRITEMKNAAINTPALDTSMEWTKLIIAAEITLGKAIHQWGDIRPLTEGIKHGMP